MFPRPMPLTLITSSLPDKDISFLRLICSPYLNASVGQ